MLNRRYILIIVLCVFVFVIVRFVNYLGDNSNAIDKAPIINGKGTIENVEFIPEHDATMTYRRGRTRTYHVADAYSIKVHIDEEGKTGAFHTYTLGEGEKWKVGDKVSVQYKKTKTFFFMPTKIYITSIRNL